MTARLCIAVHDVAPATWSLCEPLLDMLDSLGAPPSTLLIVPDWHGQGRFDTAPAFLRAIDQRIASGDEVALHGYFHRDDAAPPRTPSAWVRRRLLTNAEGEFADLAGDAAQARIHDGLGLLRQQGWTVQGFVPPAWLAGPSARRAIRRSDVRWTSTHGALVEFDAVAPASGHRIAAPCLTASPRSAWRRVASRLWLRSALRCSARVPLLRVGLHPADVRDPGLMACWRDVLAALLDTRQALTKSAALSAIARERQSASCARPVPITRDR